MGSPSAASVGETSSPFSETREGVNVVTESKKRKIISWTKGHLRATVDNRDGTVQLNVVNLRSNTSVLSTTAATWVQGVKLAQETMNSAS